MNRPYLSLAALFLKARVIGSQLLILIPVLLVLSLTYTVVRAMTLSPEQFEDKVLATYDASAALPNWLDLGSTGDPALQSLLTGSERNAVALALSYQVDVEGGARETMILERHWSAGTWGGSAELVSGRWPERPGEVLVEQSSPLARPRIPILSGTSHLIPVGRYRNAYSWGSPSLLAAPGTWSALRVPNPGLYPNLRANQTLYWRDSASPLVMTYLEGNPGTQGLSIQRRWSVLREVPANPLIGIYPLFGVPLLTGLFAGAWAGGWHRRVARQLLQIGIPPSLSRGALLLYSALVCLTGGALGLVGGWLLGAAARPIVQANVEQDLSPVTAFPAVWAGMLAALVAGAAAGQAAALVAPGRRRLIVPSERGRGPVIWGCRLAAGSALVGALWIASGSPRPAEIGFAAGLVVLAGVLVIPDLQRFLTELRTDAIGPLLALQRVRDARVRSAVTSMAVAAIMATVAASTTVMLTAQEMANLDLPANQPPHSVTLGVWRPAPVSADILRRFEEFTGLRTAIAVRPAENAGAVAVVDTAADAERLLSVSLSADQRERLSRGTALVGAPTVIERSDGGELVTEQVAVAFPQHLGYEAVMTRQGASVAGVTARSFPGYYFMNASPDELARAQQAASSLGLNATLVDWYRPPDSAVPPTGWELWMVSFGVVVAALCLVVARAQNRELRPYLRRLNAVGVGRRWLWSVVATEYAVTVGLALGTSLLVVVGVIALLVGRLGAVVVVPWTALAVLFGSCLAGGLLSMWWSATRLAVNDG